MNKALENLKTLAEGVEVATPDVGSVVLVNGKDTGPNGKEAKIISYDKAKNLVTVGFPGGGTEVVNISDVRQKGPSEKSLPAAGAPPIVEPSTNATV